MPTKVSDKDSVYYQTEAQKWLWQRWLQARRIIFKELEQADELVIFLMGDAIHGAGKGEEVFTTRLKTQKDTFIDCLLPYTNRATSVYAIKGSPWHVSPDGDGFIEDEIASELGCFGLQAYDKLEISVQNIKFMLQHKGPSLGTRRHTRGNIMRATMRDAHYMALENGREAADIYLWAHFHEFHPEVIIVKTPEGHKEIRGYITPSFTLANEYALARVKNLELSDIGIIWFEITDGEWKLRKKLWTFDNITRVIHN